jgi:hypothetical protein
VVALEGDQGEPRRLALDANGRRVGGRRQRSQRLAGAELADRAARPRARSPTATVQRSSDACASAIVVMRAERHQLLVIYVIAASTTPLRCARRGGQTATSTP